MRLGNACLTLGMADPKMRAAQFNRWKRGLVELAPIYAYNADYARRAIEYSARHGLMAYRLSTDIFPLLDCDPKLRKLVPSLAPLREAIQQHGIHVSNHPGQFALLSTPHPHMLTNALGVLRETGWTMERIGATGSITIHGGGVYDDRPAAAARIMSNLRRVSPSARKLLVLENDEHSWTVPELLDASDGRIPIVFDKLHWQANARSAPYWTELRGAVDTWPSDRIPEFHYSEQAKNAARGAHAPYITGRGLLEFLEEVHEATQGRDVSVIVEAKRKDLAIARAVGELQGRDRRRLLSLVPDLARAPRGWITRSAKLEPLYDAA
jgi:UV DNA damage endonuclease